MRLISGLLLSFLLMPVSAAVYKWVGDDGVVHYSDKQSPGAEEIRLPEVTRYQPVLPTPTSPEQQQATPAAGQQEVYSALQILVPGENETIRNNEGRVEISLLVEPALQEGHKFHLSIDGQRAEGSYGVTQLAVENLNRGTHVIQAFVVDQEGKDVISSVPVNFHLRRFSALHPTPKPIGKAP